MAHTEGDLLVRSGAITSTALREALSARARGEGTLGECLVKLGVIDDDRLATFYHKRLVVPILKEAHLRDVPPDVLALVPAEVAVEFRVLPIALDKEGSLLVAMADPSDNHAVEEITFFVDKFILRAAAPQAAVRRAIEQHYGVSFEPVAAPEVPRAAFIAPESTSRATAVLRPSAGVRSDPAPPAPRPGREPTEEVVVLTRRKRVDAPAPPPPAVTPSPPSAAKEPEPLLLTTLKGPERTGTLPGLHAAPPSAPLPVAQLRGARDRDEVAHHLLAYAGAVLERAVLFVVKGGALVGFDARGGGLDRAGVQLLQIPLDAESLFRDVIGQRLPYRGPLPDGGVNRMLARALGTVPSSEVLALPIQVRTRVVAILFGDRFAQALPEASLQALCHEAGLAYERIILQNRAIPSDPDR